MRRVFGDREATTVRTSPDALLIGPLAILIVWLALPLAAWADEGPGARLPHRELPPGAIDHAAALVDRYFEKLWADSGTAPAKLIDDAAFLRRSSLALNGVPPMAKEVVAFVADTLPEKRAAKVDELLVRSRYADYWAFRLRSWITELREVKGQGTNLMTLYRYARQAMAENRSWTRIASDLVGTQGNIALDGRANFGVYFDGEPNELAEAASRLFLGTNLACAQCHTHPYVDEWTQETYWGLAAYFARTQMWDINIVGKPKFDERFPEIGRSESSVSTLPGGDAAIDGGGGENRAIADVEEGEMVLPDPEKSQQVTPTPLGGSPIENVDTRPLSRRRQLTAWIVQPDNPYVARAAVNRFWLELTGRGFVSTSDGFSPINPVRHEPLLRQLADQFAGHQHDLKWLLRTIVLSRVFQTAHGADGDDTWHCARRRTLNSDQWHDTVLRVTGEEKRIYTLAADLEPLLSEARNRRVLRRRRLLDVAATRLRGGRFASLGELLPTVDLSTELGPVNLTESDRVRLQNLLRQYTEIGSWLQKSRSQARASMSPTSEALLRMNGQAVASALGHGTAAADISTLRAPGKRLDAVFLSVLGRGPSADERKALQPALERADRERVADLLWVLIQSTEFQTF